MLKVWKFIESNYVIIFYGRFNAGSATSTGGQNNVEQIFEEVFQAHNQQEQLKAIKKVIVIVTIFL